MLYRSYQRFGGWVSGPHKACGASAYGYQHPARHKGLVWGCTQRSAVSKQAAFVFGSLAFEIGCDRGDRLAQNGFKLFGRHPPRIAQVDFVVFAAQSVTMSG